jgi:hypothetical protein
MKLALPCPRCDAWDTLESDYGRDRRGRTVYYGKKCSACGYKLPSSLGQIVINEEKKLP